MHQKGNWLRDAILGGQDGLVNVLGISLGLSAAQAETHIILVAGLAATFAEAVSMGAVAYTSTMTEKDHFEKELAREYMEVKDVPEIEKEEIRIIYRKRGFAGELLEKIVETISSDDKRWVDNMMLDELHLVPVSTTDVLKTSFIVTITAIVGSLIPLVPFMLLPRTEAIFAAVILSAITLFLVGAYEATSMIGNWLKSGLRMVLIGLGAALVGFIVARIFHVSA